MSGTTGSRRIDFSALEANKQPEPSVPERVSRRVSFPEPSPAAPMSNATPRRAFDDAPTSSNASRPSSSHVETPAVTVPSRRAVAFGPDSSHSSKPPLTETGPRATPVAQQAFAAEVPPAVLAALTLGKTLYPDIVKRNEMRFRRKVEQLVPFKLDVVTSWGTDEALGQSDLTTRGAHLVRTYADLNGSELVMDTLAAAKPSSSFLQRLVTKPKSIDECRLTMAGLKEQLNALLPECEKLTTAQTHQLEELTLLLGALSVVCECSGTVADMVIATSLDQRRRSLQSLVQQAKLLQTKLVELRGGIGKILGDIDYALTVSLPAIELARINERS